MRKRNYKNLKEEKWVLVTASVIILGVFTVTGILMREPVEDKVIIDFTLLEEVNQELAKEQEDYEEDKDSTMEANSGTVTIPTLDRESVNEELDKDEEGVVESDEGDKSEALEQLEETQPEVVPEKVEQEVIETSIFTSALIGSVENLQWPVVGNILLNYSMDKTIYFPTLKQYKYHPGVVIQAVEGALITSASAGVVEDVYYDTVTGNTVVVKVNDTYSIVYGQLKNVTVEIGSYLEESTIIGEVASPTKYYTVEGSNVYFELRENGVAINPLSKLE